METAPTSSTADPPTADAPLHPTYEAQQPPTSTSPAQAPAPPTSNENEEHSEEGKERDPKFAQLTAKIATLNRSIAAAEAERDDLLSKLKSPTPNETIKTHIHNLHTYNEIRDIGTGLIGLIAEKRGVRVKTVFQEMGLAGED